MSVYNFKLKIVCGENIETKISLQETTSKPKLMKFKSGLEKTNTQLAFELNKQLSRIFYEVEFEYEHYDSKGR